jgi:hypothetical protein
MKKIILAIILIFLLLTPSYAKNTNCARVVTTIPAGILGNEVQHVNLILPLCEKDWKSDYTEECYRIGIPWLDDKHATLFLILKQNKQLNQIILRRPFAILRNQTCPEKTSYTR